MNHTQQTVESVTGNRNFLLSLVIPCYNETARISLMLQGVADFEKKWKGNYEVIIVDDGSKDGTADKIKQAIETEYIFLKDKAHIEQMPVNGGKGSALKRGVSLAKGDYILTLDADMSTKPAELIEWEKKVSDIFNNERTIFIASRKHADGEIKALKSRRIIGSFFNVIVQLVTSLELSDTQCGFKLYPGKIGRYLFGNMYSKGWAHDVELLHQANVNGIPITEMPVHWENQPESKVNMVKDSIKMFFGVITIRIVVSLRNISPPA